MRHYSDEGLLVRIGREIRILRESSHMTQGELAKKLRFKKEAVARIERGEYNMLMGTLFEIAHIFGRRLKIYFVKIKGGV